MSGGSAEKDARSTHLVYRIGQDFSYYETPCFCPATKTHPVDQTRVTPPATGHLLREASGQTEQHNADASAEHATSDPWFDERTPTRAEVERDEAGWDW